jgi:transposase
MGRIALDIENFYETQQKNRERKDILESFKKYPLLKVSMSLKDSSSSILTLYLELAVWYNKNYHYKQNRYYSNEEDFFKDLKFFTEKKKYDCLCIVKSIESSVIWC